MHINVYFVACPGVTMSVPLRAPNALKLILVQEEAPLELQMSVEDLPMSTVAGCAESVTLGGAGGGGEPGTVTVVCGATAISPVR